MYRRRGSNEIEPEPAPGLPSEQGSPSAARNPTKSGGTRGKKQFRKSASAEPSSPTGGFDGGHRRKKSFTQFWSHLFGNGNKLSENRLSGISTQSSSFESVNTILSTNSFSFVSPKKYKGKPQKGKRIPVSVEDQQPMKPRRKISTLTRIGMRIGLKSKYNLQSCESLHHLSYLESQSNTGTLSNTYRKKRRAPPPPQSNDSMLEDVPENSIPIPPQSPSTTKVAQVHSTANADDARQFESSARLETFKITARHRRSSSEGASTSRSQQSQSRIYPNSSNTLSYATNRSKCHVRGKRKAPVPPNPFGDPDLFLTDDSNQENAHAPHNVVTGPLPNSQIPSQSTKLVPQSVEAKAGPSSNFSRKSDVKNISSGQVNTEDSTNLSNVSSLPIATASSIPPASSSTVHDDDEIAQNILNEERQQSSDEGQRNSISDEPQPGPSRLSAAPTEGQLQAAQRDLQVLITMSATQRQNENGPPPLDERVKLELTQLKRESDKSPLMFLRAKSSKSTDNRGSLEVRGSALVTPPPVPTSPSPTPQDHYSQNSLSLESSSSTPEPKSPTKLIPRPWYKRNSGSSIVQKKTKQLLHPLPGMTKFSDIDREAARIVEENRRRTAEQGFHESARELITMFNAFNRSQMTATNENSDENSDRVQNSQNEAAETQQQEQTRCEPNETTEQPTSPNTTPTASPHSPAAEIASNHSSGDTTVPDQNPAPVTSPRHSENQVDRGNDTAITRAVDAISTAGAAISKNTNKPGPSGSSAQAAAGPASTTPDAVPRTESSKDPVVKSPTPSDEPRKLAIVQPQSSSRPSSSPSTSTTPTSTNKVSVGFSSPTFCNYSAVTRKEDWTCARCTLKNPGWRLSCEACYFKGGSSTSVQKLSTVFENRTVVGGSENVAASSNARSSTALIASGSNKSESNRQSGSKPNPPPCENFLSQFPAKEMVSKEEKLSGIKLDEGGEELDIVQLRQARLAFFQKNSSGGPEGTNEVDFEENTNEEEEEEDVKPNNLATETNGFGEDGETDKRVLNVFSDDEDDSIDRLLGIPRKTRLDHESQSDTNDSMRDGGMSNNNNDNNNAPNFGSPRNWNPFQLHRFRPMLESILESSNDVYARLDYPVYENLEFGPGQQEQQSSAIAEATGADKLGRGRTWTNTFMPMHEIPHNSPTDNSCCYYSNSNSDSSSCSECDTSNSRQVELSMDGTNRGPSRRRSSHHHHHHRHHDHHHRHFSAYFPSHESSDATLGVGEQRKLSLEDYRQLGAIPKYLVDCPDPFEEQPFNQPHGYRHRSHQHRRRSQDAVQDDFGGASSSHASDVPSVSEDGGAHGKNTLAVNKLLRRLETAIAAGDHRLAASLAHDLALLKVNCVVAKDAARTKPITIRVYVEDRFMQQGPFQVQVTQAMTVRELKQKIEQDWSIPSPFQKWIVGRKIAEEDEQTLVDFDIQHDSLAFLYLVTPQIDRTVDSEQKAGKSSGPTKVVPLRNSPANTSEVVGAKPTQATNLPSSSKSSRSVVSVTEKNIRDLQGGISAVSGATGTKPQTRAAPEVAKHNQIVSGKIVNVSADASPPKVSASNDYKAVSSALPKPTSTATTGSSTVEVISSTCVKGAIQSANIGGPSSLPKSSQATSAQCNLLKDLPETQRKSGVKGGEAAKRSMAQSPSDMLKPALNIPVKEVEQAQPKKVTSFVQTDEVTPAVETNTVKQSTSSTAAFNILSKGPAPASTSFVQTTEALRTPKNISTDPVSLEVEKVPLTNNASTPAKLQGNGSGRVESSNPTSVSGKTESPVGKIEGVTDKKVGKVSSGSSNVGVLPKVNVGTAGIAKVTEKPKLPFSDKSPGVADVQKNHGTNGMGTPAPDPVPKRRTKNLKRTGDTTTATSAARDGSRTPESNSQIADLSKIQLKTSVSCSEQPTVVPAVTLPQKLPPAYNNVENQEHIVAPKNLLVKQDLKVGQKQIPGKPVNLEPAGGSTPEESRVKAELVKNNNIKLLRKPETQIQATVSKTIDNPMVVTKTGAHDGKIVSKVQERQPQGIPWRNAHKISPVPPETPPPLPEKKLLNTEIKISNTATKPPKEVKESRSAEATGILQQSSAEATKAVNDLQQTRQLETSSISTNLDVPGVVEAEQPQAIIDEAAASSSIQEKPIAEPNERGDKTKEESYLEMVQLLEQSDLIFNAEELECPVCFSTVGVNQGVTLRDCLHSFCKECLIGSIQYADEPEVKCPYRDDSYACNSAVLEREIKALVPPEIFERHLAKSVKIAESKIVNTFHCKTADCAGWCVFEDDVNVFNCPVCKKRNCLTCQAIHEGVDCQQYQRQLAIDSETDENAKSSRLMLEKMIQRGEALECPACHVVLLKKWGCDWVRCSYCKTEICWITKGFRWGPNGKGDTSGGCKCGVNGVRCHPKCTYCH